MSDDVRSGDVGDVVAHDVTVKQGGARSISADSVAIRQGGAARVHATQLRVTQGGVALARTEQLHVTGGLVGGVLASGAHLEQTKAQIVVARESVEIDQGAAALVVTGHSRVRDSAIGVVITSRFEGSNNRVLFGPRAALAFGAGVGLVLAVTRALFRRR